MKTVPSPENTIDVWTYHIGYYYFFQLCIISCQHAAQYRTTSQYFRENEIRHFHVMSFSNKVGCSKVEQSFCNTVISHVISPFSIILYYLKLFQVTSIGIIRILQITLYNIVSYRFVSNPMVSNHTTSCRIMLFAINDIVLPHVVRYHILSHDIRSLASIKSHNKLRYLVTYYVISAPIWP